MASESLPWVKEIGAAIALVTSIVAFVRLVSSGWSAFWEVLTWAGVVFVVVFTAFSLYAAIKPNAVGQDTSLKQRASFGAIAIGVPVACLFSVLKGDKTIFTCAGASTLVVGVLFMVALYQVRQRDRAMSVKTCPDCAETIKVAARVCRYCGYRFVEADATTTSIGPAHPGP